MTHTSGYVAVLGRPNVGKSTLMNALLGQKVAAVSPRPQTTRRRQLGIYTTPETQVIFVDTPGVHQPVHKLGRGMNALAREALTDSDVILFLADGSEAPREEDHLLAGWITALQREASTLLVLNKMDLLSPETLAERLRQFQSLLPASESIAISAARGDNRDTLLQRVVCRLPEGPAYFPEEQITDLYEREIAADLIREACLLLLRDEIPHGIAVRVDEYQDRGDANAYVSATLLVERETHKAMVIGKNGLMIKKIGSAARVEIETLTERKIFLELSVKVQKDWRDDENALQRMGMV